MKKIIFIIGILVVVYSAVFIAANLNQKSTTQKGKISVVATLFPLYDYAKNIGGDKVEVSLLLPPGIEAHTFEPKPSDMAKINESDLFIYTGKFMEPWAEDIIRGLSGKEVVSVNASIGMELMKEERKKAQHEADGIDPHTWLDFDNAKIMVANITKTLVEKDPANASYYRNNAQKYNEKLIKLDNDYKATLAKCQSKEIVYGGHYAFGYLAKRYGLSYTAAQGFSPDSEPTANDLIGLVEQIKKNNIKYVFYEELSSPKIAETLSKETGIQMLLLNGAHNLSKEDYENNATYISLMESNLKNLSTGLLCTK